MEIFKCNEIIGNKIKYSPLKINVNKTLYYSIHYVNTLRLLCKVDQRPLL